MTAVDTDSTIRCAQCGYDLRMIDPAGVCPECATSIAKSVEFARDPFIKARGSLRRAAIVLLAAMAARWLLVGLAIYLFYPAIRGWIAGEALHLSSIWPLYQLVAITPHLPYSQASSSVVVAVWWLIWLTHLVGGLMVTRRIGGRWKENLLRLVARYSPMLSAGWLVALAWLVDGFPSAYQGRWEWFAFSALPTVLLILWSTMVAVKLGGAAHLWAIGMVAALATLVYPAIDAATGGGQPSKDVGWMLVAALGSAAASFIWISLLRQTRKAGI